MRLLLDISPALRCLRMVLGSNSMDDDNLD
jgi:hypothetical protein